jgi:cytochrome P450
LSSSTIARTQQAIYDAIPGPQGLPGIGVINRFLEDPTNFMLQITRRYGNLVRMKLGPRNILLATHPDMVRHVIVDNVRNYTKRYGQIGDLLGEGLVTSNGSTWLQQRRLMQPAFHHQRIAGFAEPIINETERMVERWQIAVRTNQPLNIASEMMELAQNIIVRTMFSMEVRAESKRIGDAFTHVLNHVIDRSLSVVKAPENWPTPANQKYREALAYLERTVAEIIEGRRKSGERPNDLLSMLLETQDADTGARMTDKQIRDEVMTIFFAGHETTASVLGWTLYFLAQHPAVERRVREEQARVLEGRRPAMADIPRLTYSRQVFDEVLRFYPPGWFLSRIAQEDDELGGYKIPAGSVVSLSPFVTHHLPEFWDNPEGFDPERFSPEQASGRHKFAYLPFLNGPRKCIGDTFALTEMQLALPIILQHVRLSSIPGYPVRPRVRGTMRPGTVWMQVERA